MHLIEEGKIKSTWHAEDWSSALEQMLSGKGEPLLEFPEEETYETITEIPQAMTDFYTEFLSNAGSKRCSIFLFDQYKIFAGQTGKF